MATCFSIQSVAPTGARAASGLNWWAAFALPLVLLLALSAEAQQNPLPQQLDSPLDPQLDPQLTSRTIHASGLVTATDAHPWAGFWKLSCKDEFGLAFIAAKPSLYSILFCGPFACSRPGTFQPDSAIKGDPIYRLDDTNQIGILDRNSNFRLHVRCATVP